MMTISSKTMTDTRNRYGLPQNPWSTTDVSGMLTGKSTETPYQKNLRIQKEEEKKWYKGDEPTTREIYGRIGELYQYNPDKASSLLDSFRYNQSIPGTQYYNPHLQPTNQAVSELANLGIDVSGIDSDDWFTKNAGLQQYYKPSDTTNKATKPGKNSSVYEQAAYWYNQAYDNHEQTKKARGEVDAVRNQIQWMVNDPNRNWTDDEIVDEIKKQMAAGGKYATLGKVSDGVKSGEPYVLNTALDYSEDGLYGMVWAARNQNPDGTYGTGFFENDIIMSAMGEGNQYVENPEIRAKLDPNNPAYAPYSLGSTAQGLCLYFGVYSLDRKYLESIRDEVQASGDQTKIDNYNAAWDVVEHTEKLDNELQSMNDQIDRLMKKDKFLPDDIINTVFGNDEYKDLFELDATMQNGTGKITDLVPTAWAVDYKGTEIKKRIREQFAENHKAGLDYLYNTVLPLSNASAVSQPESATGTAPQQPEITINPAEIELHMGNRAKTAPIMANFGTQAEKNAMFSVLAGNDLIKASHIQMMSLANADNPNRGKYLHNAGERGISSSEFAIYRNQHSVERSITLNDEINELTVQGQQQRQDADNAFNALVQSAGVTDEAEIGAMKTALDGISTDFLAAYGDRKNHDELDAYQSPYYVLQDAVDEFMKDPDDLESLVEYYADYMKAVYYSGRESESRGYFNEDEEKGNALYNIREDDIGIEPGTNILWDLYKAYQENDDRTADILSAEDLANPEVQQALANAKAVFQILAGTENEGTTEDIASYITNNAAANETENEISGKQEELEYWKPKVEAYNRAIMQLGDAIYLSESDGSSYDLDGRLSAISAIPKISETEAPPQSWQAYTYYDQKARDLEKEGKWDETAQADLIREAKKDAISTLSDVRNVREAVAHLEENGVVFNERQKKNINDWCDEQQRQAKWAYYYSLDGNEDFQKVSDEAYEAANNGEYGELAQAIAGGIFAIGETVESGLQTDIATKIFNLLSGNDISFNTAYKELGNDPAEVALTLANLTREEKARFFYLLGSEKHGEAEATEYIRQLMDPEHGPMYVRNSENLKQFGQTLAESGDAGSTAGTIASFFLNLASIPMQVADMLSGEEFNPYSPAFFASDLRDALRQGTKNRLHEKYDNSGVIDADTIDLLYDAFISGGDSLAVGAVTTMGFNALGRIAKSLPGISKIVSGVSSKLGASTGKFATFAKGAMNIVKEAAHAAPMGLGAATNAYREAYIRSGGNEEMAEKMATVTFLAETLSEAITISNMHGMFDAGEKATLGSFKEWFWSFIKDAAEEALGESMNELVEAQADKIIMGAYSNYEKDVQDFMNDLGCSREEAERLADEKMWKDVLKAGLSAIVTSGMTESGSYVAGRGINSARQYSMGGDIIRKGGNDMVAELTRIGKESGSKQAADAAQALEDTYNQKGKYGKKQVGAYVMGLLSSDDVNIRNRARKVLGMEEEVVLTIMKAQDLRADEIIAEETETKQQTEQQAEQEAAAPEGEQSAYWTSAAGWRNQRTNDLALLMSGENDTANTGEAAANITNVLTGTAASSGVGTEAATAAATTIVNEIADGDSAAAASTVRMLLEESHGSETNDTKKAITWAALTNGKANKILNNMVRRAKNGAMFTYDDVEALRHAAVSDKTGQDSAKNHETYDNNVQESRKATLVMDRVNSGELNDAVKGEQKAVETAEEAVQNTQEEVDRTTREADASAKNLMAAGEEYVNRPVAGGETETPFQNAMAKHVAAVNQKTQAEQGRKNAQEKLEAAQKELDDKTQTTMNGIRADATDAVNQESQQKAADEAAAQAKAKEEEDYQKALADNGIVAQENSEESDRPATYEETEAKRRARFGYENGVLTYHGPNSESMDQELEKAGFHREETVNMETGEAGYVYSANREDVSFDDVKRLNDMVNQQEDEQTGKAQEDRENAAIEQIPQAEALEGVEAENRADELKEQRDKVRIKLRNLKQGVTTAEGDLVLKNLGRKLGIAIELEDLGAVTKEGFTRGKYTKDGRIILNKNLTIGQALVEAALHEITHAMEKTGAYRNYRNIVMGAVFNTDNAADARSMYDSNADFRAKVDQVIKERIAAKDPNFVGKELDDQIDAAEREIVADFARLNLAEKDVVDRFVAEGIGGKIRNALHNINQMLKNYMTNMTPEERQQAEYFRKAERAFQKAIDQARKQASHPESDQFSVQQMAQATGMYYNPEVIRLDDGTEIPPGMYTEAPTRVVDGKTELVEGVEKIDKITPKMMEKTPVGMLIDMGLSDELQTNRDGTPQLDDDGKQMTQKEAARKMFADLMTLCNKYFDNNLIWEIAGSEFSEAFSALKSNSDPQYKTTVDFGTICSKTQAIIDVLSKTMINRINDVREWNEAHPNEKQRVFTGLSREDIMMVYDQTHNAKLSVPCPVCYVFSRWMGVPSLLGQMNKFQHEYVVTKKDANGKTLYDANGDAVIDKEATKVTANKYIKNALERYGSKDKIADAKTSLTNKINKRVENLPKLNETKLALQEQLKSEDLTKSERTKLEKKLATTERNITKNIRETDQFTKDLADVEAFNWVTQALCKQHTEAKGKVVNDLDENGDYVIDDNFRLTPEEILFDLNRTGEFAGYTKNWRYRTTRGAGMGKAIMPYSGASIGDLINGSSTRWSADQNPFAMMDEASAKKAFNNAKERVRQQNLVGGQRFQSTSDFRPEWGLDYIMSFLEMQALGSKVQMYTKVAEAVDFLGSIGADVNQSIMGKGNGWHLATLEEIEQAKSDPELRSRMGVTKDENGVERTFVMDFSDVTGMDYNTAKENSKKYNSVQMILVGMNDIHIRLAIGNEDIDFVIPWHSSGNSKDVIQQLVASVNETLTESSDYTDSQTDQIKSHKEGTGKNQKTVDDRTEAEINLWNARVKLLSEGGNALTEEEVRTLMGNPITAELYKRFTQKGYDPDCYNVKLPKAQAEQIFPYEYWDKNSTRENADKNGQTFAAYCDALGLVPRFSQFKDDHGYWKLLIDRKMYENNTYNEDGSVKEYGKYRDQQVVDVTKSSIGQLPTSTTARYGSQYSEETNNAIAAASAVLRDKYDVEGRYSAYGEMSDTEREMIQQMDKEYSSVVKVGRYDLAEKMVDEAAKEAGYTIKAYHGTPNGKFNVFEKSKVGTSTDFGKLGRGFYFTSKQRVADYYAGYLDSSTVMPVYLKLENPLVLGRNYDNMSVKEFYDSILGEGGPVDEQRSEELTRWLIDHEYDGIIAGNEYMVLDSANIKSAEPATYDKYGDLIPLSERFNDQNPDIRYSTGGEESDTDIAMRKEQELNDTLVENGVLSQEEANRYNAMMRGEDIGPAAEPVGPQRQFGNQTSQNSDELDEVTKRYLYEHSNYAPDTNQDQIERAVQWIRDGRMYDGDDGFQTALQKVTGKRFNSQTPDGQARTLATLAMAVAKGDITAQIAIADAYNREGTTAGQTLQSRKIFRLMTPEGRIATLRKMLTDEQSRLNAKGIDVNLKFSDWIYRAAASATEEGDFTKVRKAAAEELGEQVPVNWKERLNSLRMLSMLANPRTHIRNIIGNALFIPAVSLKNKMGAVMELGLEKGQRTKTLKPILSKEIRDFARKDAKWMKDTLTGEAKYNERQMIDQSKDTLPGFLQTLSDLNSKALEGEDWIFLKGHYRRALGGWMTANGYTVEQVKSNPELLEAGRKYAIEEAQKATYRDFSAVAQFLNSASRSQHKTVKALGFAFNAVLPFKKTPINILKRGVEYSPVGLAKSLTYDMIQLRNYQKAVKNGKGIPSGAMTPTQVINDICAGLSGTAITVMGMLLANIGAVSVGMGDDDDEFEKLRGTQEYAVRFNLLGHDVTFTMDWAAPMSMPFFVGAAIQNQMEEEGEFDIEKAVNAVANISEPVFNLSMLEGVNNALKTSQYDDTNEVTQIGAKILSNYVTSFVPSFLGAAARTIDDKRRKSFVESGKGTGMMGTFRYALEQAQNKIPWYSMKNIPYTDVWGNDETSDVGERILENFVLPGYIQERNESIVVDELERLYNATGSKSLIPKYADRKIELGKDVTDNPREIVLTDKEWYTYHTTRGQTAYRLLGDMMTNDYYLTADPEEQVKLLSEVWEQATIAGKKAVAPDYNPKNYYGDDPIPTIVKNRKTSTKNSRTEELNKELIKALDANDSLAYDTVIGALDENGVSEKSTKTKIGNVYRPLYQKAYLEDDLNTMLEIEEKLDMTDFKFDYGKWKKDATKKQEEQDED